MLRWTRRLLLRRTHPWPHRDDAGPGIVEGGPRRDASVVVAAVVAGATGAVVLAFHTHANSLMDVSLLHGSNRFRNASVQNILQSKDQAYQ
jgi:hypothetical protein